MKKKLLFALDLVHVILLAVVLGLSIAALLQSAGKSSDDEYISF